MAGGNFEQARLTEEETPKRSLLQAEVGPCSTPQSILVLYIPSEQWELLKEPKQGLKKKSKLHFKKYHIDCRIQKRLGTVRIHLHGEMSKG